MQMLGSKHESQQSEAQQPAPDQSVPQQGGFRQPAQQTDPGTIVDDDIPF
jgi:single-stranded DNA-binding protein